MPSLPPSRLILAAGLTPAWQQILVLDHFESGEVNRAREAHWCASGKVLNVGLALHQLGARSRTLAPIGGLSGEAIRQECARLGLPARWIQSPVATRVCTTLLDARRRVTTELVENSRPLPPATLRAYRDAFRVEAARADYVVLSGSLPDQTPSGFYRELVKSCRARVILDGRGEELLAVLALRPLVVKPNREELGRTVGRPLRTEADVIKAMRALNRRGAEWVVITHGGATVLATHRNDTYRFRPPPVPKIANPIGCGDCLAAGLAWALQRGETVPDAIQWGMAAAADNIGAVLPARVNPARVAAFRADCSERKES